MGEEFRKKIWDGLFSRSYAAKIGIKNSVESSRLYKEEIRVMKEE